MWASNTAAIEIKFLGSIIETYQKHRYTEREKYLFSKWEKRWL
jgi:hypothetical protein